LNRLACSEPRPCVYSNTYLYYEVVLLLSGQSVRQNFGILNSTPYSQNEVSEALYRLARKTQNGTATPADVHSVQREPGIGRGYMGPIRGVFAPTVFPT